MSTVVQRQRKWHKVGNLQRFPLYHACFAYAVFLIASILVRELVPGEAWMLLLVSGGAVCFYILWRQMDWLGNSFMSFGAVLLLAGAINRVLYALDILLNGDHFDNWPVVSSDPGWALVRGEAMSVIGTFLVVYSWIHFSRKARLNSPSASLISEKSAVRKVYWLMYVIPLLVVVLQKVAGTEQAVALGSIMSVAFAAASCSILALSSGKKGIKFQGVLFSIILSLPYVFLALGTGMKENFIISIIPTGIIAWQYFKGFTARIALILIGTLLIGTITSFVGYYRERVWYAKDEVATLLIIEEFMDLSSTPRHSEDSGNLLFLARNNATYARGWSVDLGDQHGIRPWAIFGALTYIFIPRFLWPNKPLIQPGLEHSALIWGEDFITWSTSSTSAGFFPALYMGGGYIAVIIISLGMGWLVDQLQRLVARSNDPYAVDVLRWMFFLFALRLDETWPVYAVSGPIISVVYVLFFTLLIQLLATGQMRIPFRRNFRR